MHRLHTWYIPELRSISKVWMVVNCICSSTVIFAVWSSTSIFLFHLICYSQILIRCNLKYTHTHTSSSILDIKKWEREREVAYRSSESARSSCTASNPPFSSSWDNSRRNSIQIEIQFNWMRAKFGFAEREMSKDLTESN